MKWNRTLQLQTIYFSLVLTSASTIVLPTNAITSDNPYGAITGRNVFALKPPQQPTIITAPTVAPPGIELQGISTILGRPQVLLKIKMPAHPPEPPKDKSVVLDIGQREGDVEVVAIDNINGVIKLKNQGNELSLSMKDNAAKPAAGVAIPTPAVSIPAVQPLAAPNSAVPESALPPPNALPARNLRAASQSDGAISPAGNRSEYQFTESQKIASGRNAEQNAALRLASQLRREQSGESGPIIRDPRLNKMLESGNE